MQRRSRSLLGRGMHRVLWFSVLRLDVGAFSERAAGCPAECLMEMRLGRTKDLKETARRGATLSQRPWRLSFWLNVGSSAHRLWGLANSFLMACPRPPLWVPSVLVPGHVGAPHGGGLVHVC